MEPFVEGKPGPHVLGPLSGLRRRGIEVSQGPFGNTVEGDRSTVASAVMTILEEALERGASRISINLTQGGSNPPVHPTRSARREGAADDPIASGQTIGGSTRPEDIHGAVGRMVGAVEARMGGTLGELSREKKQAAVRILDEQGVFLIRKSVETVAEAMGVSRITIYNYLNAIRGD